MSPPDKGKGVSRKPTASRKSTLANTGEVHSTHRSESTRAPVPSDNIRSRLRQRPSIKKAQALEDNSKPSRRKPTSRKVKKPAQSPKTPVISVAPVERVLESTEVPYPETYQQGRHKSTDEETSPGPQDTDTQQAFFLSWGYLPPLDEEVVDLIKSIMSNSTLAKETSKLINSYSTDYPRGLQLRNVLVRESAGSDSFAKVIENLKVDDFLKESNEEEASHGLLWDKDLEKCTYGSNEALFQRTVMMFLIARHCLIYKLYKIDGEDKKCLDFSVEEPWICWPMPTRAYDDMENFLTQPKPDLAICFVRNAVIPDYLWNGMPKTTQQLACYEKPPGIENERVFHFCTIEAKKAFLSSDDPVAKYQSLNNASQALHNMFEFFQDAGEDHKEIFFAQVRFFSAVASTEGLTIRIHRAVRDSGTEQGFIIPEYPLRFEHQEFLKILKTDFNRRKILETFTKIFIGYGVNRLRLLLCAASKALMAKLKDNPLEKQSRQNPNYYRYGQVERRPKSRKSTPMTQMQSFPATNSSFMSVDTNQSITGTPGPDESFTVLGKSKKRKRKDI